GLLDGQGLFHVIGVHSCVRGPRARPGPRADDWVTKGCAGEVQVVLGRGCPRVGGTTRGSGIVARLDRISRGWRARPPEKRRSDDEPPALALPWRGIAPGRAAALAWG